jgi:hypothetical protein
MEGHCWLATHLFYNISPSLFWRCGPSLSILHEISRSHTTTQQSVGLLSTSDLLVAKYNTFSQETDIHVPDVFRTQNLSRRTAAELRLRPRRRWDRLSYNLTYAKITLFVRKLRGEAFFITPARVTNCPADGAS